MPNWDVVISRGQELQTVVVEALNKVEAVAKASEEYGSSYRVHTNVVRHRGTHGGARKGSGQPSKHGEPTKVVRLPESLANDVVGFVQKYRDLERLINDSYADLEKRKHLVRAKEAYTLVSELKSVLDS